MLEKSLDQGENGKTPPSYTFSPISDTVHSQDLISRLGLILRCAHILSIIIGQPHLKVAKEASKKSLTPPRS